MGLNDVSVSIGDDRQDESFADGNGDDPKAAPEENDPEDDYEEDFAEYEDPMF